MTLIRARPFADEREAERWLAEVSGDRELWAGSGARGRATLNRGLHAHRTATLDPYVSDVTPDIAVAIRFGYGTGEEVADGRWTAASELAERDRVGLRREIDDVVRQERIAAALGGRESAATAGGLVCGGASELEAGRLAGAALRLRAALDSLREAARTGRRPRAPYVRPRPSSGRVASPTRSNCEWRSGAWREWCARRPRAEMAAAGGPGSPELARRLSWALQTAAQLPFESHVPYSAHALRALERRRVGAAIEHAYAHVPHWREAMRERGLVPADFRCAADLGEAADSGSADPAGRSGATRLGTVPTRRADGGAHRRQLG